MTQPDDINAAQVLRQAGREFQERSIRLYTGIDFEADYSINTRLEIAQGVGEDVGLLDARMPTGGGSVWTSSEQSGRLSANPRFFFKQQVIG
jgi:hypothetical protein